MLHLPKTVSLRQDGSGNLAGGIYDALYNSKTFPGREMFRLEEEFTLP